MTGFTGLARLWAQSVPGDALAPGQTNAPNPAPQIMKLLRAKTDPQVIQAFIQSWNTPYLTSADDLVRLRNAGATPALLDGFAQRGAELRLRHALAHPESRQNVVFYPSQAGSTEPPGPAPNYSAYPFSDALWWWANRYPLPYLGPTYGFGFWGYPRRGR